MSVFIEKFGWGYDDYMHKTNFLVIDLMLVDSPRMLSEDEKKKSKQKKAIKVNNATDLQSQLNNLFK